MGWELDSVTENIEPVVTDKEVKSDFITVKAGQVTGVKQLGLGKRKGEELIRLEFEAYLGHQNRMTPYILVEPPIWKS